MDEYFLNTFKMNFLKLISGFKTIAVKMTCDLFFLVYNRFVFYGINHYKELYIIVVLALHNSIIPHSLIIVFHNNRPLNIMQLPKLLVPIILL